MGMAKTIRDIVEQEVAAAEIQWRSQDDGALSLRVLLALIVNRFAMILSVERERANAAEQELHDTLPACGHEHRFYDGGQYGECVRCRVEAAEARLAELQDGLEKWRTAAERVRQIDEAPRRW